MSKTEKIPAADSAAPDTIQEPGTMEEPGTAQKTDTAQEPGQKERTIEEAFQELDALAQRLEDRETSLEDSFLLYKQGMELLKYCSQKLDTVEKKMLQINEDGTFSEFSR